MEITQKDGKWAIVHDGQVLSDGMTNSRSWRRLDIISGEATLAKDAQKFNAPAHWGNAIEAGRLDQAEEILPLSQPKIRRAKARNMVRSK